MIAPIPTGLAGKCEFSTLSYAKIQFYTRKLYFLIYYKEEEKKLQKKLALLQAMGHKQTAATLVLAANLKQQLISQYAAATSAESEKGHNTNTLESLKPIFADQTPTIEAFKPPVRHWRPKEGRPCNRKGFYEMLNKFLNAYDQMSWDVGWLLTDTSKTDVLLEMIMLQQTTMMEWFAEGDGGGGGSAVAGGGRYQQWYLIAAVGKGVKWVMS